MKKLTIGKKTTIISNLLIAVIIAAVFTVGFSSQGFVAIYGENSICAIYRGNVNNKKVSLMFNVYENAAIVGDIVDTLDEYGAKATFFVGGCWADDNGKTLEKIVSSGHEIANHGYFHKDHKKLDANANAQEIELTEKIVYALCGARTTLFAPPSGSFSDKTLSVASELGYRVIMWSSDTIDWRDADEDKVFTRATKNLSNGELVLMHPKAHTLAALPRVLDYYRENGFSVVTVSDNLS